jgi:hypothetical protein
MGCRSPTPSPTPAPRAPHPAVLRDLRQPGRVQGRLVAGDDDAAHPLGRHPRHHAATPAVCATARRSSKSACRPARCSPPAAPKPKSPTSSAWPAKTSAAGGRAGWKRWQAAAHRLSPTPVAGPTAHARPGAPRGCPRARLRHRPLDPGPHRHGDPAVDRGRLPSRARLEAAAPHGLAAAAPRPSRRRAGRAGHRPLDGRGLALGSGATPAAAGP